MKFGKNMSTGRPTSMRVRKNYRSLSPTERQEFIEALEQVKANGIVGQYASVHASHFGHSIHRSSHFLPWHREFIRRFEDALRAFRPEVMLPYWDSTVDRSPASSLWRDDFLGQFDQSWGL